MRSANLQVREKGPRQFGLFARNDMDAEVGVAADIFGSLITMFSKKVIADMQCVQVIRV